MCGLVALVMVACGRATQEDIDNALNITPTTTLSAEQVAQNTAAAVSEEETRTAAQAALASPGADGAPVDLASAGNPTMGRTAFLMRCQGCHNPAGAGAAPALAGPDNPATALSDQELVDLLRTGEGREQRREEQQGGDRDRNRSNAHGRPPGGF